MVAPQGIERGDAVPASVIRHESLEIISGGFAGDFPKNPYFTA